MKKLSSTTVTKDQLIKTINDQNLMLLRAQDREIGLMQELNAIKAGHDREELLIELALIKASFAYKFSLILSAPFRAIGLILRWMASIAWRAARKIKRTLSR